MMLYCVIWNEVTNQSRYYLYDMIWIRQAIDDGIYFITILP